MALPGGAEVEALRSALAARGRVYPQELIPAPLSEGAPAGYDKAVGQLSEGRTGR